MKSSYWNTLYETIHDVVAEGKPHRLLFVEPNEEAAKLKARTIYEWASKQGIIMQVSVRLDLRDPLPPACSIEAIVLGTFNTYFDEAAQFPDLSHLTTPQVREGAGMPPVAGR